MNIFATNQSPTQAALDIQGTVHYQNKMLVEACQMLGTTVRLLNGVPGTFYDKKKGVVVDYAFCLGDESEQQKAVCKVAYPNHPCTIWTAASLDNFLWLYTYARTLVSLNPHNGCAKYVQWIEDNVHAIKLPAPLGLTEPARAFKDFLPDYTLSAYKDYTRYLLFIKQKEMVCKL